MTHEDLTTLLDFHYWARTRMLDAAEQLAPDQFTRDLGSSFPSVRDTLVHMYSAEMVWYQRWHGTTPTSMLLPAAYPDVPTLRDAWTVHEGQMRGFLASLGDAGIARTIEYRSLAGHPSSSAFWEMFLHIVNHGTYHRGQVTTMLRQLGAAPARSVDLVVYYRERNVAR